MPLALNWYGTVNNEFTDLLVTGFMENENMTAAGFVVQNQIGDFPRCLTSSIRAQSMASIPALPVLLLQLRNRLQQRSYDYSYNWTIDPGMYDDYSICYFRTSLMST